MFTCGAVMRPVEPAVVPCVHRPCEDECGEGEDLSGDADDEDGGKGVHDPAPQLSAATPSAQVSTFARIASLS